MVLGFLLVEFAMDLHPYDTERHHTTHHDSCHACMHGLIHDGWLHAC